MYDPLVLGFSNRVLWRCKSARIVSLYNQHLGPQHLDIGPGTGWFLEHCTSPALHNVTLLDAHPDVLRYAAHRLRPRTVDTILANVLTAVDLDAGQFDSVGLNYLLHCLPGDMRSKSHVFALAARLLAPHGTIFGSTILATGDGISHTFASKRAMRAYNAKGLFGNRSDSLQDLRSHLEQHFISVTIETQGAVALFTGHAGS